MISIITFFLAIAPDGLSGIGNKWISYSTDCNRKNSVDLLQLRNFWIFLCIKNILYFYISCQICGVLHNLATEGQSSSESLLTQYVLAKH